MFGYRAQITRQPCRNGLNCYYFRNGNCWFEHPEWHRDIISPPDRNRNANINSFSNRNLIMQNNSLERILEKINRTQALRQRLYQQGVSSQDQKQQENTININGKQIKLLKMNSTLDKSKAWFFDNCHHFQHFSEFQLQQCPICINNFQKQQIVTSLFCKHAFHSQCIQKWLKTAENCPLCRKDFRQHPQFVSLKGYSPPVIRKFQNHLTFSVEYNIDYSAQNSFSNPYSQEISIQQEDDQEFDDQIGLEEEDYLPEFDQMQYF